MTNWASTMATPATTTTKHDSDDLLASLTTSFNRNHISQEAIDIDTLQAQLKQALSQATSPGRPPSHHPNTPTQTSATLQAGSGPDNWAKFHWTQRGTRSKAASFSMIPGEPEDLMMIEEEKEVENLLEHQIQMLQSPGSTAIPVHPYPQSHFSHHASTQQQYPTHVSPSSSFTATDPFYAMSTQSPQPRHSMAPQSAFFNQSQK